MNNSLNEALKARAAAHIGEQKTGGEMHLDDVARVKVLSPGRQVFKRFVRNRLAVFGSCLLIAMFVFSFLGPLFYAYGQKQIFYKYSTQNVNYALAKSNTTYNGYVVYDSVDLARPVVNAMNSNIKNMIEKDEDLRLVFEGDSAFLISRLGREVYTLSKADVDLICTTGKSKILIGNYSQVGKKLVYSAGEDPISGLDKAAADNCKGKGGSFTLNGVVYTFEKGAAKSFDIYVERNGLIYSGEPLGEEFEEALDAADQSSFVFEGNTYLISASGSAAKVYRLAEEKVGRIYTLLTVDTYETGVRVAEDFRASALMAAYSTGEFTSSGEAYTIEPEENGSLVVHSSSGDEYAEFTDFTVRRYTGEDTMDYDLKNAITDAILEMLSSNKKSSTLSYALPMQNETGSYVYDETGALQYNDSELTITQRDTGEFVINCEQIIYVINMFESPSAKHILGTDGDGFDVLARIMYGGRVSLMVGFVVVFLETFLGIIMGGLAGYYGKWVDNLIMRLVDIFYCLPSMPIMIILGAMMDALRMNTYIRLIIMMAALGLMGWAGVARLVRGQILSLREQEFMVATEATGIKVKSRIFRHLVPNVMPQLIVTATMGMGSVIITESTLSFLGLGVKHPLATWGTIINSVSSASAMAHYAFIWIPVGLLICLTVIAFNFVGDGLRDAYDPKSKR
ncbi:MAG: ABC transporter permease [Oscillospiraceae bacterium]|nr:ABC transporter permease [Oscillospiraceae bacterium]